MELPPGLERLSYTDIHAAVTLENDPKIHEDILELRAKEDITREELVSLVKIVKDAADPVLQRQVSTKIARSSMVSTAGARSRAG